MRQKQKVILILMAELILLSANLSFAGSTPSGNFSWSATNDYVFFYGSCPDLDIGDEVGAFDPNGICCGGCTVKEKGLYGFMAVYGDDPKTESTDEGAEDGDTITFKIYDKSENKIYDVPVTATWKASDINTKIEVNFPTITSIPVLSLKGYILFMLSFVLVFLTKLMPKDD